MKDDGMSAPPPDAGDEFVIASEDVLAFVRAEAARRDPGHAHWYPAMSSRRIKNACLRAQALLETHLELHRRMGRGARTGRRKHAQQIYALLNDTNDADLMLAIAFLEASLGVLQTAEGKER